MLAIHGADYAAAAQANTTGRFANPMEGHGGTLLFYFPILLLGFFPWSGLLPAALWHVLKEWKSFRMGTADARGEPGLLLFCRPVGLRHVSLFHHLRHPASSLRPAPVSTGRPAGGRALVPFLEERPAGRPDRLGRTSCS